VKFPASLWTRAGDRARLSDCLDTCWASTSFPLSVLLERTVPTSMADIALVTRAGHGLARSSPNDLREGTYGRGQYPLAPRGRRGGRGILRGGHALRRHGNCTDPSAVAGMFETSRPWHACESCQQRVIPSSRASNDPRTTGSDSFAHLDCAFRCIRCALPALIPVGGNRNILAQRNLQATLNGASRRPSRLLVLTLALAARLRDDGVSVQRRFGRESTARNQSWTRCRPQSLRSSHVCLRRPAELTQGGPSSGVDCDCALSAPLRRVERQHPSTSPCF